MFKYLLLKRISLNIHKYQLLSMARIILTIDDELDAQFRSEVARRLGRKKGNIKVAIEEAIKMWMRQKI